MNEKYKILNFIKREINPYGKPFKGTDYEFGLKIMDYIKNMEDESGWIPADERLPEAIDDKLCCESVLILLIDGRVVAGCYRNDSGTWWDGYAKSEEITEKVVAWMPLPNPYKEG